MKITAIIIDDLSFAVESLQIQLAKYKEVEVVATASNMDEAVKAITEHKPELLFLDIKLDKHLGFKVLDKCKDMFNYIIFTTAYAQYAIKSFEYNVIYYLLKPIQESELKKAIEKLNSVYKEKKEIVQKIDEVKKILTTNTDKKTDIIYFPDKNVWSSIHVNSIIYIQADASYSNIYTDSALIKASKNLTYMQGLLTGHDNFVRIHRSYIININYILNIKRGLKSSVTMNNQAELPISSFEKAELFQKLGIINEE